MWVVSRLVGVVHAMVNHEIVRDVLVCGSKAEELLRASCVCNLDYANQSNPRSSNNLPPTKWVP